MVRILGGRHIQLAKVVAEQAGLMEVLVGAEKAVVVVAVAEEVQPGNFHLAYLDVHL